jgi:hypothetical protein
MLQNRHKSNEFLKLRKFLNVKFILLIMLLLFEIFISLIHFIELIFHSCPVSGKTIIIILVLAWPYACPYLNMVTWFLPQLIGDLKQLLDSIENC